MIKRNSNQSAIMLCLLLVIIQQPIQALPRPSFSMPTVSMPTFATSKKMATKLGKITAALVAIGILGDQAFQRTQTFKTKAKELIDSDYSKAFTRWVMHHFEDLTTHELYLKLNEENGTFFSLTTNIEVLEMEKPPSGTTFLLTTQNNPPYNGSVFLLNRNKYHGDDLILTIIQDPSFYKDLVNHADEYIVVINNTTKPDDERFINSKTNTGLNNDGKKAHIFAQDMKKYATDNPSISDYVPLFIQKKRQYNSVWFRWKVFKSLFAQSDQPPAAPAPPPASARSDQPPAAPAPPPASAQSDEPTAAPDYSPPLDPPSSSATASKVCGSCRKQYIGGGVMCQQCLLPSSPVFTPSHSGQPPALYRKPQCQTWNCHNPTDDPGSDYCKSCKMADAHIPGHGAQPPEAQLPFTPISVLAPEEYKRQELEKQGCFRCGKPRLPNSKYCSQDCARKGK